MKLTIIRKGEGEGHPFRGNQWTRRAAARRYGDRKLKSDFIRDKLKYEPHKNLIDNFKKYRIQIDNVDELESFLASAYEFSDGTYSAEITNLTVNNVGEKMTVYGNVYDRRGNSVGTFERTIKPGWQEVHHDFFAIDAAAQGTGFGSQFYQNSEALYKAAGFKLISIFANIDIGGYAWARMGFDFASSSDRETFTSRLMSNYQAQYGVTLFEGGAIPKLHAWDIAAWTGPDGDRIGKSVMLGYSWGAIKRLDDNDPSYKVGQIYYNSKKKKKGS